MNRIATVLAVFVSGAAVAQGFDYAGYGIADPVAFQMAAQQSNALIMQQARQMQQAAAAYQTAMQEMARRMPQPTPQQQFAAYNAMQDAQLLSLQMQNSSLDAEMSANAYRRRELELIREQGEQRCAWASGVTLAQYRKANEMGIHQLNGSGNDPQADDTYYGNQHGDLYRIDQRGNAYEVNSTGEYLVP